jgi:hypothetical protein
METGTEAPKRAKVIRLIPTVINIYTVEGEPRCDCMGGLCACGEVHELDYVEKKYAEAMAAQAQPPQPPPYSAV